MRFVIALTAALAAVPAAAQLYRWTDESGKVHFTDTPPPAKAKNVERRSAGGTAPAQADAAAPYALQLATKNAPVTLYSAPGCEPCNLARNLLNARGVPFKEVSVTSAAQIAELQQAVGGNSVPAILIGKKVQTGFEEGMYQALLDSAGYPRTGILPPRKQSEPKAAEPKKEPEPAAEPPAPLGPYSPARLR